MQSLEEATQAKQAWSHYVQVAEASGIVEVGLGQELKQLKDKDRVQTLLSLLTGVGVHRVPTWGEGETLLREGRRWIQNILQLCLQEARNRGEMVS